MGWIVDKSMRDVSWPRRKSTGVSEYYTVHYFAFQLHNPDDESFSATWPWSVRRTLHSPKDVCCQTPGPDLRPSLVGVSET